MAVLVNGSASPRDVWTETGWTRFEVGASLEIELSDKQVLELLELGFSEAKPTPKPKADAAK